MADSNEAQLLSDLLRDIAREDANIDAAHLETRVMSAFARSIPSSFGATPPSFGASRVRRWAIGAAVAVAVLGSAVFSLRPGVPVEKVQLKVDMGGPAKANGPAKAGRYVPQIAKSAVTRSAPAAASPIAQSPIAPIAPIAPINPSLDEFVPLMAMTERELSGPFQLVRVQMPRASLGALRSPLEHPNELVEADVLLGEDGMARAIRVSASGSVYPWRSR